jgi:hypothetical protein
VSQALSTAGQLLLGRGVLLLLLLPQAMDTVGQVSQALSTAGQLLLGRDVLLLLLLLLLLPQAMDTVGQVSQALSTAGQLRLMQWVCGYQQTLRGLGVQEVRRDNSLRNRLDAGLAVSKVFCAVPHYQQMLRGLGVQEVRWEGVLCRSMSLLLAPDWGSHSCLIGASAVVAVVPCKRAY